MAWIQSTMQNGLERGFGRSKLLSGQTDNFKFKQVPISKFRDGEQMSFWHAGFWTTKLGGSPSRRRVPRTSASSPGKWSDLVEDSTLVWFFRKVGRMRVDFNQRRSRCSPIVPPQLGPWELRKVACSVVVDHFWRGGVGCLTWEWKHGVSFELIVMSFWFIFL